MSSYTKRSVIYNNAFKRYVLNCNLISFILLSVSGAANQQFSVHNYLLHRFIRVSESEQVIDINIMSIIL